MSFSTSYLHQVLVVVVVIQFVGFLLKVWLFSVRATETKFAMPNVKKGSSRGASRDNLI